MRVLVVHNRYSSRSPSGENLAVDDEIRWLGEAGVDVVSHQVSNDEMVDVGPLARVRDGLGAVWSLGARRRFEAALDESRPDLVHVHNLFPLLTSSVPTAATSGAASRVTNAGPAGGSPGWSTAATPTPARPAPWSPRPRRCGDGRPAGG